jgi:hypothetical protein
LFEIVKRFQAARARLLKTELVELLVVDNCSSDNTYDAVRSLNETEKIVTYKKQATLRETAETSMAHAVRMAEGEYVWVFGDDDIPHEDSLASLIKSLKEGKDFYLLNCKIQLPNKAAFTYLPKEKCKNYSFARDLWLDLGFVSATTTISSLCFRRSMFDLGAFEQYAELSEVYSHSVALCSMFHGGTASIISTPLFTYSQNTSEEEECRFKDYFKQKSLPFFFPFTFGLFRLLIRASSATGVCMQDILNARESEVRKDTWQMVESTTGGFIKRFSKDFKKSLGDSAYSHYNKIERLQCLVKILAMEYCISPRRCDLAKNLIIRYLLGPAPQKTFL